METVGGDLSTPQLMACGDGWWVYYISNSLYTTLFHQKLVDNKKMREKTLKD